MKHALILLFLLGSISHGAEKTAQSPGDVQSEIEAATKDVSDSFKKEQKAKARRQERIRNATSVQDRVSPSERRRLKKSIPSLEKKVAKDPENARYRETLGKAYLLNGDYVKAIEHLREASHEGSVEVQYLLAEAYRGKRDFENEIRTLSIITQTRENDAKAQELLGHAYYANGDVTNSTQHFRKALALDKKRRTAYDGLIRIFEDKKNSYELRVVYTDMAKVFGADAQAYSGLCRLAAQENLTDQAIESCQKAISIDSKIPDNHVHLGLTYKFLQQTEQAHKILIKTAKDFPKSELALYAAGQVGDDLKNWEHARHYYRKCVKIDPQSARCFKRLAHINFELKDYAESLKAFESACQLDRTVYSDIRNATSQLRLAGAEEWKEKFQLATDRCGIKN